jgi:NADH-quinone oxidoreductase subunit J
MDLFNNILEYIQNLSAAHWFFFLFAAIAVGAALEVVMQRSPLNSAIALVVAFAALAANYILLSAQFIAAIQIIVYAGAIMVLFVFVIMLLNVRAEESRLDRTTALKWIVSPALAVLFVASFYVIRTSRLEELPQSPRAAEVGTVETIGYDLFREYLLPFEAASVLIMMAIVGALVLAKRAERFEPPAEVEEVAPALPPAEETREEVEV